MAKIKQFQSTECWTSRCPRIVGERADWHGLSREQVDLISQNFKFTYPVTQKFYV